MKDINAISDDMLEAVTGGANVLPSAGEKKAEDIVSRPKAGRPLGGNQILPFICPHCHKQIMIPALNDVACPECNENIHISG